MERKEYMETTLCYIERDGAFLMLHRTKKKDDLNSGKWIGVGGKIEPDETPEECIRREVFEETGLKLLSVELRGRITFVQGDYEEVMHLFTSDKFEGEVSDCNEGELKWIPISEVFSLNLWEGDRYFLEKLIKKCGFFRLTLVYDEKGEKLIKVVEK